MSYMPLAAPSTAQKKSRHGRWGRGGTRASFLHTVQGRPPSARAPRGPRPTPATAQRPHQARRRRRNHVTDHGRRAGLPSFRWRRASRLRAQDVRATRLAPECGAAKLKKAYKKASLQYHPDKQSGKTDEEKALAASMFLKIKEAYELLSDDTHSASLDDAVAGTMRAQRAHAERTARMDASTKRFRDDLERREREAASAKPPMGSEAEARLRNQQKQNEYGLRDAAKERARAERRSRESQAEKDARQEKLRRTVEVKFGRESVGDDVLKSTGCLSVERPSSKKALLIFDSAEAAVQCAIDEEFGSQFKDVKLKTADAWERIRAARRGAGEGSREGRRRPEAERVGLATAPIGRAATLGQKRRLREASGGWQAGAPRGDVAGQRRRCLAGWSRRVGGQGRLRGARRSCGAGAACG